MQNTLRFISIVYILLLSVGLFAHVEIVPGLLSIAKRDSWISILLSLVVLPVWVFVINKILLITKKRSIIHLLKETNKGIVYSILLFPLAIYMLLNAFVTAKEIVYWSQISYMQGFNNFLLAAILLLFCVICSRSGLFSIGVLSSILCPLVLFLGFFISFANMKRKNYELLFPLFTEGYVPIVKGLLYTSLPILELFIIIFLTPVLKKVITKRQLLTVGFLIVGLTLGPTIAAIAEFGPEQAVKYRFPAYEQWRLISIGRYFSHADFFAVFQWLSGGVIRISLFVLISCEILTKGKQSRTLIRLMYGIILAACTYPIDQSTFIAVSYGVFRPLSFFFMVIQMSIIAVYLLKNKKKSIGG